MSADSDPSNSFADPMAVLFAKSHTAGLCSTPWNGENRDSVRSTVDAEQTVADLRHQVQQLSRQLAEEQQMNQNLLALNEFGKDLDIIPDTDRAARSMARLLARLIRCGLVCIFSYSAAEQRFKLLSSAGPSASQLPGGFLPDTSQRVINQAVQQHRLISSSEMQDLADAYTIGGQRFLSLLAAPLVRKNVLHGLILLADPEEQRFNSADLPIVESAAVQLLNAWEYAHHNVTLTEFVQEISKMSVVQEVASLLEMTASIARQMLGASYVLAASLSQPEWVIRGAGHAPRLSRSFLNGAAPFLEAAAKSPYTFRLRDLRQDARAAAIELDSPELCSLLACPIRINGAASGILLAFGKNGGEGFTDTDVFLTELLVSQAAMNLESCFLNHELRANLKTTQLLYDLSLSISKAENLKDAARAIARTAYRLLQARKCGLILFAPDGRTEAEVHFPTDDSSMTHPQQLIQQSMNSRQTIYLSETAHISRVAIPIQTNRRCYGALWMEINEDNEESRHPTEEIRILVNQAAVALERSILLEETRQQASEIARSYHRLEAAYEDLLYGLTKALDARDGETEKHSWRVEDLSVRLGVDLGLSRGELQALKRGALLHDIGKIGVRDAILLKKGPLDEGEWQEMRQHPKKGAEIIEEIPALHDALPVIAFHQERWDGSGYPEHRQGTQIPLLARIFAVVDVFDALTSDRPYRKALPVEEALAYLESQAGIHFDPDIVARFARLVRENSLPK